jgi:fatty acid desaturase
MYGKAEFMAAVSHVHPLTVFNTSEWSQLTYRSAWRGVWYVVHCWGVIVLMVAMCWYVQHPLLYVLAIPVIGTRQLGLAILMHDASHGTLHPRRSVNDWLGQWLCGAFVGADLFRYRSYHLKHHKFTQQSEDPDLSLTQSFPVTASSLRRKLFRDLTGQTFFSVRIKPFLRPRAKVETHASADTVVIDHGGIRFAVVNVLLFLVLTLTTSWWVYLVLWLVPLATWFMLSIRIRNMAEHACVSHSDDPFHHARTTRAGWVARMFIAPYFVNFHIEHHLFMSVPCWTLPRVHRQLIKKGYCSRMEVQPGYLRVLQVLTSADA